MFNAIHFSVKIISAHHLEWGKQHAYVKPRPYDAISFRVKGKSEFTHGENTYKVKSGDIIYVPKNYYYVLNSFEDEEVLVIHFETDVEFKNMLTFTATDDKIISSLFLQAVKAFNERPVGYMQKMYSLFYQILEQIELQKSQAATFNSDTIKQIENSVNYIKSNFYDNSLTIEKLAIKSAVSTTYYRKIFNKLYGVSPIKYLTDVRLSHANALLKSGYHTVEETATKCGFSDSKYFATCYKKKYGMSPGKDIPKLFKKI